MSTTPRQERQQLRRDRAAAIRATHGPNRSTLPVVTGGHLDHVPVWHPHEEAEAPATFPGAAPEAYEAGGRSYWLHVSREGLPFATVRQVARWCDTPSCSLYGHELVLEPSAPWCPGCGYEAPVRPAPAEAQR